MSAHQHSSGSAQAIAQALYNCVSQYSFIVQPFHYFCQLEQEKGRVELVFRFSLCLVLLPTYVEQLQQGHIKRSMQYFVPWKRTFLFFNRGMYDIIWRSRMSKGEAIELDIYSLSNDDKYEERLALLPTILCLNF